MHKPAPQSDDLSDTLGGRFPASIYGFVWRVSGRHQIALSILSIAVFALSMAPLEFQRRIVNEALKGHDYHLVALLCGAYAATALFMGGLKLGVNVYRGYLGETATRRLRRSTYALAGNIPTELGQTQAQGIELALVISEVEPVGNFVGIAVSEPLLQGGILVTVFGYMLVLQPWMAAVCLALYIPQMVFVPLMQAAINRRAAWRIQVMRRVSAGLIDDDGQHESPGPFERRISRIFDLNMQMYVFKFTMNFLMNGLYHMGVVGVLLVGGWFVINGRIEAGTVVAFLSGLSQVNDPWGDLVNYFRDSTSAQVKYRLIANALSAAPAHPAVAAG